MMYPSKWRNNETSKTFVVTRSARNVFNGTGERIHAVEPGGQFGFCDYHVAGVEMDLHQIESHPEKGTGLGSLLMYLMAVEAARNRCVMVNILSAAANERGFYALMGCGPEQNASKALIASMASPPRDTAPVEVWPGIFLAPSNTPSTEEYAIIFKAAPFCGTPDSIMDAAHKSISKRWELLH